jgi:separase
LYASLALQYLRLGYTGKAGALFAQGLKQMKDFEPSTSTQIFWHLNYSEYFSRMGVISKAKYHVSQAGEIYTRSFNNSKKLIDPSEKAERILAVGQAGFVLSLIAFEENELEKAIGHIDYAIRVLKTGIAAVERAGTLVKTSSRDYDPFSSDAKPVVEQVENRGIQFGSKLWSFKSVSIPYY